MPTASTQKIKAIDATYYTVKDLPRATKFYSEFLGFEPTVAVPELISEWTFPGDETLGLYKPPEGEWRAGGGVMFQVDDINASVALCKSRGVKLEDDGKIEDTPVCHMAFAEDTEGNHFIIHKRK